MEHLIVASLAPTMLLPFMVLRRVKINPSMALGDHIAKTKATIWYGRVLIPIATALVTVWFYGWYAPTYDVDLTLRLLVAIVCATSFCAGLIPSINGKLSGRIHNVLAWTYAGVLPVLIFWWAVLENNLVTKAIIIGCLSLQLSMVLLFLFYHRSKRYFLYFQLAYIVLFGVALFAIAYPPSY